MGTPTFAIKKSEWARIEASSRKPQEDNSYQENQLRKKEISRSMTSNWSNTLASVQKQREQRHLDTIRLREEAKVKEYEEIMAVKKEETERILREAQEYFYENKESSRRLVSSLVLSAVLEERRRQVELNKNKKLKEKEKIVEQIEEREKLIKEIHEESETEIKKAHEKKINYRMELDKQMEQVFQEEYRAYQRKEQEILDLLHIRNELAEKDQREKEEKERNKQMMKREIQTILERAKKDEEDRIEFDKQEEESRRKYNKEHCELKEKIRECEMTYRLQMQNRNKLAVPPPSDEAEKEARLLEKAQQERAELLARKDQQEAEKRAKLVIELIFAEKEARDERAKKAHLAEELKKWEAVQRVIKAETDEEFAIKLKEENREKKLKTREMLDKQIKEKEERKKVVETEEKMLKEMIEEQEKTALVNYCNKIRSFAEEKNFPLHPINATIQTLKQEIGLLPKREKPQLVSRVPINNPKC